MNKEREQFVIDYVKQRINKVNIYELYEFVAECRYCPLFDICDSEDCEVWLKRWVNESI